MTNELLCRICECWKPEDDFYRDSRSATKRKRECKLCYNQIRATDNKRKYDRDRKAQKYADHTWRKAYNKKRSETRFAAKINKRLRYSSASELR